MKKKLITMIALGVVLGLAVSAPAGYAASHEGGEEGYGKAKREGFFKELNLTPEQKEKMKAHRETQKGLHQQEREQMKSKMHALHAELAKPVTDRAVINGLIADINTLKGQMFAQRIDGVLALKEILTPEQFAKLQAKHKEHGFGKRGGWMKDRPGASQGTEQVPDEN